MTKENPNLKKYTYKLVSIKTYKREIVYRKEYYYYSETEKGPMECFEKLAKKNQKELKRSLNGTLYKLYLVNHTGTIIHKIFKNTSTMK